MLLGYLTGSIIVDDIKITTPVWWLSNIDMVSKQICLTEKSVFSFNNPFTRNSNVSFIFLSIYLYIKYWSFLVIFRFNKYISSHFLEYVPDTPLVKGMVPVVHWSITAKPLAFRTLYLCSMHELTHFTNSTQHAVVCGHRIFFWNTSRIIAWSADPNKVRQTLSLIE